MKKIMLFLFAFICINHALEAKIWYTNWPNMGPNCVIKNDSVVEFDLIFEVTDPTLSGLKGFYLEVNGTKHYISTFDTINIGQSIRFTKRIAIPHNDQQTVTYNVDHSRIPNIFVNQPPEDTTKNICFKSPALPKLAADRSSDTVDKVNSSVNFIDISNRINISPNPFNSNLSVSLSSSEIDEEVSIELIDLSGRVVKKKQYFIKQSSHYIQHLETSDLMPGVYFCKVSSKLKQNIVKLIKNLP